jgi:hypothetical protein
MFTNDPLAFSHQLSAVSLHGEARNRPFSMVGTFVWKLRAEG